MYEEDYERENLITLRGTGDAVKRHIFEFSVLRCDIDSEFNKNVECATPDEIDEYVEELEISVSVVENIVDFHVRDKEPIIPL